MRKFGVSKENRRQPIVQLGLFLDGNGNIFAILKAFGMELKQQLYTRGEIREMKATANPF